MRRVIILFLFSLAFSLWPEIVQARDVFDAPCRKYGLPKDLVLAIARQESSWHPWTVNVAGKDYRPRTKAEALEIINRAQAAGQSYDVGLMQVNCQWLRKFRISPAVALEPRNNAMLGCWILASAIREHGMTWKAVGVYHSPTPARQLNYARRVAKHLNTLRGQK